MQAARPSVGGAPLLAVPPTWQAISVYQLRIHTSGIPNYTTSPEFGRIKRTGATTQQMIELVGDNSVRRPDTGSPPCAERRFGC
jgi:hypothetical protein